MACVNVMFVVEKNMCLTCRWYIEMCGHREVCMLKDVNVIYVVCENMCYHVHCMLDVLAVSLVLCRSVRTSSKWYVKTGVCYIGGVPECQKVI